MSFTGVASDESMVDNLDGQIPTSPPLARLLLALILPPTQLNSGGVEGRRGRPIPFAGAYKDDRRPGL